MLQFFFGFLDAQFRKLLKKTKTIEWITLIKTRILNKPECRWFSLLLLLFFYGSAVVTLRYKKTVTRGGLVTWMDFCCPQSLGTFGWTTGHFLRVCVCVGVRAWLRIKQRRTLNMSGPDRHLSVAQTRICAGVPINIPQRTSGLNKSWTSVYVFDNLVRIVPFCLLFRSDRLIGW